MSQADQDHLLMRAEQERALASKASDEIVRAIHLKLAFEYSMRAHRIGVAPGGDNEVPGIALQQLKIS